MNKFKLLLLALLATAGFNSCSKDDEKKPNEIEGGTVHTSELVTISSEGLSQDVYEGMFNDAPVKLANNDSGGLVFFVQPDLALMGEKNILEIPGLKMKINYTVKQTALPGTPEETLAPFIGHLNKVDTNGFSQGEKVRDFLDSFNDYYASLSAAEKTVMAEYYHANSDLFGSIVLEGRPANFLGLDKCQKAQFLTATLGGAAVILANPASMGLSILSGAGAVVSFMDAVEYCTDFMSQKLKQVFLQFDDMLSSRPGQKQPNNAQPKQMDGVLTFTHGEAKSFQAGNGMRSLQASDASDSNSIIAEFFSLVESLNNFVLETLNGAITLYNNEVPSFFQMDLFETPIPVPANGVVETQPLDQEIFGALTFSVGSSEVGLDAISFSNGEVNLTLNMADPNAGEISTTLDYVFKDDFNERQGSFPVVVSSACAGSDLAVSVTTTGSSATATASGGTSPYTYEWSNGDTGQSVSGLSPGSYAVTVTDDNGCEATANVMVGGIDLSGNWIMKIDNPYNFGGFDNEPALYRFVFNQNTITFNQVTVISDGYQEDGSSLHEDLVSNTYTLSGNDLLINLEYQWSDSWNCDDIQYDTVYTTTVSITASYDENLGEFTGILNDVGSYTGPTIPCETYYPYDLNRSIEIYRE